MFQENNNKPQNQKLLAKAPVKNKRGKLARSSTAAGHMTTAGHMTRTQQEMNELNREKSEQWAEPTQAPPSGTAPPTFQTQLLKMQKQSAGN